MAEPPSSSRNAGALPPLPPASSAPLEQMAARVPPFALALDAHRQGDLAKARTLYLDLIDRPGLAPLCLHQLGLVAGHQGEHMRAAELIERAILLDPAQPLFRQNLAVSLERAGSRAGTLDALVDLGCCYQNAGDHEAAVAVYDRVLAADPARYAAHANRGTALAWLGRPEDCARSLLRAIVLHGRVLPDLEAFLTAIVPVLAPAGLVPPDLRTLPGQPSGKVEMIEHILATFGKALADLGHLDQAIAAYRLAVSVAPGFALAHWNLSLALLAKGDFRQGWREYLWRWQWDAFPEARRIAPAPEWRGEPLAGKTVLVWAEQGFGDTIQFAPLVLELARRGARVLFEVFAPLSRLFSASFEGRGIRVVARVDGSPRVECPEAADYAVSLMNLPDRLGLAPADLPLAAGYLSPLEADAAGWRGRLGGKSGLKVGLVWAGRAIPDPRRSMPVEILRPLLESTGISWYSLQTGPQAGQWSPDLPLTDLAGSLVDFADTAAAILALDLIVTIDTATAHLAGAMGKPVWILLPAVADWRWQGGLPWYPGMRLFRQATPGDWAGVAVAVGRALSPSL